MEQTVNLLVCITNADDLRQVTKPTQADINSLRTIDASRSPLPGASICTVPLSQPFPMKNYF